MGKMRGIDIPKAHIDPNVTALESLKRMLDAHPELYNQCISTPGFAFEFNQLVNRAIHFDFLQRAVGIIPSDYPKEPANE